jgi:hypothetical protein
MHPTYTASRTPPQRGTSAPRATRMVPSTGPGARARGAERPSARRATRHHAQPHRHVWTTRGRCYTHRPHLSMSAATAAARRPTSGGARTRADHPQHVAMQRDAPDHITPSSTPGPAQPATRTTLSVYPVWRRTHRARRRLGGCGENDTLRQRRRRVTHAAPAELRTGTKHAAC